MLANNTFLTNRYGALAAEVYDIDKPFGRLPDTPFWLERFRGFDRPILEPACGTGRTLIPLLEAGCDIVGFDRSPEMLERCRERLAGRGLSAEVSQQHLEDFRYAHAFGAILLPVGAFTLLDDLATARAVLRRLRDALEAGGVLIVDIMDLSGLASTRDDRRQWTAPNGDLLTIHGVRVKTDWLEQRSESLARYERWREHRLIETELEPMAQRYWGLREFGLELEAAGFRVANVVGGYDRSRAPRSGDWMITFEATRI
jgi:SAM-dependent methyltransferase